MKYIEPNKKHHHLINWLTYCFGRLVSAPCPPNIPVSDPDIRPLFVTGLFRSGTSLVTQLLVNMGMDSGTKSDLLRAVGERATLNPNGFYENYLFMDTSLYIFDQLDSWGHKPPTEAQVRDFRYEGVTQREFMKFSLVDVHDDRISNWNKLRVTRKYHPRCLHTYLKDNFSGSVVIKNPHFSVLSEWLLTLWPNARFLVVFRNPDAAVSSARKIADLIDYDLYVDYNSRLLNKSANTTYFSYDHLMLDPKKSLAALADHLDLSQANTETALKIIDPKLNRFDRPMDTSGWSAELSDIYATLKKRAINVNN